MKLRGHHNYPVGVAVVDSSSIAVTGDRDGIFKLWDLYVHIRDNLYLFVCRRTFECLQTFRANEGRSSGTSTFDIGSDNTIIAAGRKIFCFEYLASRCFHCLLFLSSIDIISQGYLG